VESKPALILRSFISQSLGLTCQSLRPLIQHKTSEITWSVWRRI